MRKKNTSTHTPTDVREKNMYRRDAHGASIYKKFYFSINVQYLSIR